MVPNWNIIGVSVQGTSHQKSKTPCQDAHGYIVLPNGTILVAIADGAGSAERSDEGSQCAVTSAITSMKIALGDKYPEEKTEWQRLMTDVFRDARQSIVQLSETENIPLRDLATTLSCAVVSDKWLTVGQIGDGIVVAQGENEKLFSATQPQKGEYASETFFLTMDEILKRVEIHVYSQSVQTLALMTDGIIRLATDVSNNEPFLPFFKPLLRLVAQLDDETEAQKQLKKFLASDRVCARTDDDKTLVLAAHQSYTETKQTKGIDD